MTSRDPGELTGVVLAGGASRRFGTDKALVARPDGAGRLVDGVVAALRPHVARVVVARGALPPVPGVRAVQVRDAGAPGERHPGPVPGILAGLAAARTAWVVTLPVDLPDVQADDVGALLDAWTAVRGAGQERVGAHVLDGAAGHPRPLVAVWDRRALPAARSAHRGGVRAARRLVAFGASTPLPFAPRTGLRDADAPAELSSGRA